MSCGLLEGFNRLLKTLRQTLLILLAALCLVGKPAQALENETHPTYWVDIGFIGLASSSELSGLGSISGLSIHNRHGLFKLRNAYFEDGNPLDILQCLFETCDVDSIEDWGLMYGKVHENRRHSLSIGVAQVKRKNSANNEENFSVYGIPIEYAWRPVFGKHFGLGLSLSANINKEVSFWGIYLKLYAGKLRSL